MSKKQRFDRAHLSHGLFIGLLFLIVGSLLRGLRCCLHASLLFSTARASLGCPTAACLPGMLFGIVGFGDMFGQVNEDRILGEIQGRPAFNITCGIFLYHSDKYAKIYGCRASESAYLGK